MKSLRQKCVKSFVLSPFYILSQVSKGEHKGGPGG